MITINKRKIFLEIASSNSKWIGKTIIMQAINRNGQDEPRIGYVVTKKLGKAVVRNRIRRRFKAAVFDLNSQFKHNYDYVIIGKKSAYYQNYNLIKQDILQGINHLC